MNKSIMIKIAGATANATATATTATAAADAATASDEEESAIDVLVRAFSADPVAQWMWPDPEQYLKHCPGFVRAFGGKAFVHGKAYYVDGYAGAALWLPPGVLPDDGRVPTAVEPTPTPSPTPAAEDVAVGTVHAGIQFPPNEPAGVRGTPLEDLVERCDPVEFLRLPDAYYEIVWDRVNKTLREYGHEPVKEDHEKIRRLGILVDADDEAAFPYECI